MKLTIDDFPTYYSDSLIRHIFTLKLGKRDGERRYRKFEKWMSGQTRCEWGVYPTDLARFLHGLNCID